MYALRVLLLCTLIASSCCSLQSTETLRHSVRPVDDDGKNGNKRNYELKLNPPDAPREARLKGITVQKNSEDNKTVDGVEFEFDTQKKVALDFAYFHAAGDIPNNFNGNAYLQSSAFQFLMRALRVFEYNELNNVAGYQNGSDAIIRKYNLRDDKLQWKPIAVNTSQVTDSEGAMTQVWFIEAETLDEVFYIRFIVAGTPVSVGGVVITPSSCKVDFRIRWFTSRHVAAHWTDGPSSAAAYPNSRVGLALVFGGDVASATHENQGGGHGSDQPQILFNETDFSGFFTWAKQADAIISGVESIADVLVDVIDVTRNKCCNDDFKGSDTLRLASFSFDAVRPSEVAWDPEFGSELPDNSSAALTFSFTLFLLALLF